MIYWTPDISKCTVNILTPITYSQSASMNYPRSQFSKHLLNFRLSYGHCDICAICATYGTSGRDTYLYMGII